VIFLLTTQAIAPIFMTAATMATMVTITITVMPTKRVVRTFPLGPTSCEEIQMSVIVLQNAATGAMTWILFTYRVRFYFNFFFNFVSKIFIKYSY